MYKSTLLLLLLCSSIQVPIAQTWVKTIGTTNTELARVLKILPDGDLLLAGLWRVSGDYYKGPSLLLRTDPNGNVKWQKKIGQVNAQGDWASLESIEDLIVTSQGEIAVTGYSQPPTPNSSGYSDILVALYDLNGVEKWRKYYDLGGADTGQSLVEMADGGLLIAGSAQFNAVAVKVSPEGELEWAEGFGGIDNDYFSKVRRLSDGHYILAGTSQQPGMGNRMFVVKLDAEGKAIWSQTYPEMETVLAKDIILLKDGGFLLAGSGSSGSGFKPMAAEIDQKGELMWSRLYNQTGYGEFFSLVACDNESFFAAGMGSLTTPFDGFMLMKAKPGGSQSALDVYFTDTPDADFAVSLGFAPDGGLIIAGNKLDPSGYDIRLMRIDNTNCTPLIVNTLEAKSGLKAAAATPNPFSDKTFISVILDKTGPVLIEIFDLNGRLIWSQQQELSAGEQQLEIPAIAVPVSQLALYRISAGGGVATGKVMRE